MRTTALRLLPFLSVTLLPALTPLLRAQTPGNTVPLTTLRQSLTQAKGIAAMETACTAVHLAARRSGGTDSLRHELETRRAELTTPERLLLAELRFADMEYTAAETLLNDLARTEPVPALTFIVRLRSAMAHWNSAAAAQLRLVKSVAAPQPALVERLVEFYDKAGRRPDALQWAGEWRKLSPDAAGPWLREAKLLADSGRAADAAKLLEEALQRWPQNPAILEQQARHLADGNKEKEAHLIYLKLYDLAQTTEERLRLIPLLLTNVQRAYILDEVRKEFERRRAQNPQSAATLLVLAELVQNSENHRARFDILQAAAAAQPEDAALQMFAAETALRAELPEKAEALLTKAAAVDKTGAAQQRQALLWLATGRAAMAAELLEIQAASLTAEEAAQVARLTYPFSPQVTGQFLKAALHKHPQNYRLAWLRAEWLYSAGDLDGLTDEYLRLATTPFAPLPRTELTCGCAYWRPPGPPILEPEWKWDSPVDEDDPHCTTRSFFERGGPRTQGPQAYQNLPRIPDSPAELRGWAAPRALYCAWNDGPEKVAEVQKKLLAAAIEAAVLGEIIAKGHSPYREWADVKPLWDQYPEHRAWLLRFSLGELHKNTSRVRLTETGEYWEPGLRVDPLEPHPAAAEAWRFFRESDPPYAVFAALRLASSEKPEERRIAEEALTFLERPGGPGPLLRGALPLLAAAVRRDGLPADSLVTRLLSRMDAWAATATLEDGRARLEDIRLLHAWKSHDPGAFLKRVEEKLTRGGEFEWGRLGIPGWPQVQPSYAPPGKYVSIIDTKAELNRGLPPGMDWPVYSHAEGTWLPGPGAGLLRTPPTPSASMRGEGSALLESRLARAARLLCPGKWSADAAKLRAALEQCTDPGLKAVGALSLLDADAAFTTQCMEALTAADASADALMFAAAWAWRQRQPDKAVALLERLSALEAVHEPHQADTAILAAAHLLLWAGEPVSDSVRRAASAALTRLSALPLRPPFFQGMARLADQLGLTEQSIAIFRSGDTLAAGNAFPSAMSEQEAGEPKPSPLGIFASALSAEPPPAAPPRPGGRPRPEQKFRPIAPGPNARPQQNPRDNLLPLTDDDIAREYAAGGQAAVDARVAALCGAPQPEDIWSRPFNPEAVPSDAFLHLHSTSTLLSSQVNRVRLGRALQKAAAGLPERSRVLFTGMYVMPSLESEPTTAAVLQILHDMGMTENAAAFCTALSPWALQRTPGDIFPQFCQWLDNAEKNLKTKNGGSLTEAIAAKYPDTFGGQLCVAVLRDAAEGQKSGAARKTRVHCGETLGVLGAHPAALKELPEREQWKLAVLPAPRGSDNFIAPQGTALEAQQWQKEAVARYDRHCLDVIIARSPTDFRTNPPVERQVQEIIPRVLPDDPERVANFIKSYHRATRLVPRDGSYQQSPMWLVRVEWTPNGDPSHSAKMVRAALKLSSAEAEAGQPADSYSHPLRTHLHAWLMRPPPPGTDPLQPSLDHLLSMVQACPENFFSEAEIRSIFPLLPVVLNPIAEMRGSAEALPPAIAQLRAPGPGGPLRGAAATALALVALHQQRQQTAMQGEAPLYDKQQKSGNWEYSLLALKNAPAPGIEDEAALAPEQKELLTFLRAPLLPAGVRAGRIRECIEKYPRLFDPPLFAAAAGLAGETPREGFLTSSLATAALHFTVPAAQPWRSAEQQVLRLMLQNAQSQSPALVLLFAARADSVEAEAAVKAFPGRTGTALAPAFRALINRRHFTAAQWLLEKETKALFTPDRAATTSGELYGPQTPQNLRDFEATLPGGPLRVAARAIMETSYDSAALADAAVPGRMKRQERLAADLRQQNLTREWEDHLRKFFSDSYLRLWKSER